MTTNIFNTRKSQNLSLFNERKSISLSFNFDVLHKNKYMQRFEKVQLI